MPTTYLLLRNNKQTGPHTLEALLQLVLQPHDLIWAEGQSAGWSYPSEITALKPYVTQQAETGDKTLRKTEQPQQITNPVTKVTKAAAHIYVSLPAGVAARAVDRGEEGPSKTSLEEKAEVLYQKVQAFAAGATEEDTDARYARSLDDMKQQYGAWQVNQREKKKHGAAKQKLLIVASVLIVTTTSFGISRWISHRTLLPQPTLNRTAPVAEVVPNKPIALASITLADSVTTDADVNWPYSTNLKSNAIKYDVKLNAPQKKNKPSAPVVIPQVKPDTVKANPIIADIKAPAPDEIKKVVPLSKLLSLSNIFQYDKNGHTITATQLTLQNNSSETLRSVAVVITYFKKEDRRLSTETVYFYNVFPKTASSLTADGNRKATSAQFEIGAITRADGSLYFIH